MRTRVVVAASLAIAATASPSAVAQAPRQDSVTGNGRAWDPPPIVSVAFSFEIDARSGPSGEDPTGQVTLDFFTPVGGVSNGPVRCLVVNGNIATLNFESAPGIVTVEVTDSPSGDTLRLFPGVRQPDDCSPLQSAVGVEVFEGDLVVVDAQPLPTSKEQCKNGGWRQYGFKNQGRCLAFILKTRVCEFLERFGHKPKFCPPPLFSAR